MTRAPDAIDRAWVRRSFTGPITAVHPPFTRDGDIDLRGLESGIEHNLAAGSGVLLLTYGDSLHSLLTDQEVGELLRHVVRIGRRRALVVAADRQWWTGKELEFADFCHDAGADILMVLPPNFGGSVTHDDLVAHYRAVSERIPVMPVTGVFLAHQALGLAVIPTLVETVPNIVAVKDDVTGDFARRLATLTHERWAVLSGGMKQNHFDIYPFGCDGYMSTYMHFMPEVAHAYWRALAAGDMTAAARVIVAYDRPWFDLAFSLPGNFDAMFHASLELFGIAGRWRRQPYHSLTDGEMERVRAMYAALPKLADVVPAYATGATPTVPGAP